LSLFELIAAHQVGALNDHIADRTEVTITYMRAALGVEQVEGNARVLDRVMDLNWNRYQAK
jgi:hypothetical protein